MYNQMINKMINKQCGKICEIDTLIKKYWRYVQLSVALWPWFIYRKMDKQESFYLTKSYVMLRSGRKGFHFLEVASMLSDSV